MARITEITRCPGGAHYHLKIQRTSGAVLQVTIDADDVDIKRGEEREYLLFRLPLLVREARAAGNTTPAQIRTYLLNLDWVE